MNKRNDVIEALRYWSITLSMSGLGLVLTACGGPAGSGSAELSVESLPVESASPTQVKSWKTSPISFDGPLMYRFDSRDDFIREGDIWLSRGAQLAYDKDHGNYGPGSVYVTNRRESWHGPLVRLPRFEAGQAYRVNIWVRLVDISETSQVSLTLTRVVNGNKVSFTLGQIQAKPNGWRKVEGEFVAVAEGPDDITTLHLDVPNLAANYYVDDLSIAHTNVSAELEAAASAAAATIKMSHIRNGDVENGLEHWAHQGGVISRTSVQAHSGQFSLLISGRKQAWNAPVAPVYGLQDNTRYQFRIYVRLTEGTPPADVQLTLKRVTGGQATFEPIIRATAVDSQWTEVSGYYSAPDIKRSEVVSVYLECLDPTANYYVDTLTVQALP